MIAFYAYVTGMTQGDAIQALGQAFGVTPIDPHAGMDPYELTNLEWKRLGIYGDRASKNFIFHVDRLSPERLWELSEKFNIPMNDLRKQHPQTYARILKQTALPHVRALRNTYYLDVYGQYRFCASLGRPDLFQDISYQQELLNKRDELKLAERMLTKAIHGTSITFHPEVVPDPNTLLKRLLRGEPELGTRSYKGMQALARKKECFIRYRSMDLAEYQGSDFSGIPHTAFVKGDRISVGFLPEDEPKVNKIMEKAKQESEITPESVNLSCQRTVSNTVQKDGLEPER